MKNSTSATMKPLRLGSLVWYLITGIWVLLFAMSDGNGILLVCGPLFILVATIVALKTHHVDIRRLCGRILTPSTLFFAGTIGALALALILFVVAIRVQNSTLPYLGRLGLFIALVASAFGIGGGGYLFLFHARYDGHLARWLARHFPTTTPVSDGSPSDPPQSPPSA